jgi:hypothetical protein
MNGALFLKPEPLHGGAKISEKTPYGSKSYFDSGLFSASLKGIVMI